MADLFELAVEKGAVLSPCGLYRYRLWRAWDVAQPTAAFVMLNPSTADAVVDDPTIRRCISFARSWGCGRVVVVNLFAFRATDPDELVAARVKRGLDVVGPDNDAVILATAASAKHLVAAWGASAFARDRALAVRTLLRQYGEALECLGRTQDGSPRHPLYVRGDTPLAPFSV